MTNTQKYFIFDFDGTIIDKLKIDYDEMKGKIKKILNYDGKLTPMFDKIINLSQNEQIKKKCFDLIDKYELKSIKSVKINKKIINLYEKSQYKFILTRNGVKVIELFVELYNISVPDFISCRDNNMKLKPHISHLNTIINRYKFLSKNNTIIVGDSWHDEKLCKDFGCDYLNVDALI